MIPRRGFLRGAALLAASATSSGKAAMRSALRARVVVAGGGFAGAGCALELRRLDPGIEVALIDPDERYVTCPMSNEAVIGQRDMHSLSVTRAGLRRAGVRYIQ